MGMIRKSVSETRGKQRKRHFNSTGAERMKKISSGFSKELRQQYGIRRTVLEEGDMVTVKVGKFKGKSGKITGINIEKMKINVDGCIVNKNTGGTALVNIDPSNVMITELAMNDARKQYLEDLKKVTEAYKNSMKNTKKWHGKLISTNNLE